MQKPEMIALGVRIAGEWKAVAFSQPNHPAHKKTAQTVK